MNEMDGYTNKYGVYNTENVLIKEFRCATMIEARAKLAVLFPSGTHYVYLRRIKNA